MKVDLIREIRRGVIAIGIACATLVADASFCLAQEMKKLRIGAVPITSQMFLYTAIENGYFKEANLDVEVRSFPNGGDLIRALNSGAVDIANAVNLVSTFQAKAQGFDIVVFAGADAVAMSLPHGSSLMVRNDSGIKSVKDLAGKKIGVPSLRDQNWLYLHEVFTRNGVDPASINWVEVPIPQGPTALLTKRVDAAEVVEPFITVTSASGEASVLFSPYIDLAPGGTSAIQIARREWAEANKDMIERYLGALRKAIPYAIAHEEASRNLLVKYIKLNEELAKKTLWPPYKLELERADLQFPLDLSLKFRLLEKPLPLDSFVYPSAFKR